jgi:hypothetical protein
MPTTATAYREFLGRAAGPLAGLADFPAAAFHALAAVGVAAASPAASADADFADVPDDRLPALLEIGTWRMLESILDNLSEDELRHAGIGDDVDKVASRLRLRVERLYARIQRNYNVGLPTLKAGVLDLGGVQRDEPNVINY